MDEGSDSAANTGAMFNPALHAAADSEDARTLLRKQARLVDLQIVDLEREDKVRHWSLRVRHISDVLKLGFELAGAAILTAIAVLIAAAVWSAAHDDSLVIEAFDVPADMAARGLTGQVLARQVQDRLASIQDHIDTIRRASTYANGWGDAVKVQIPNTGISFDEAYRYLAGALGSQTHISGELYRGTRGLTLSVRVGNDAATPHSGSETDLETLVTRAAESIYRQTQPYRYAVYLYAQRRVQEEVKMDRWLALEGAPEDRAWGYSRWGLYLASIGDLKGDVQKQHAAYALNPNLPHVIDNMGAADSYLGHDEAELKDAYLWCKSLHGPAVAQLASYAVAISIPFCAMEVGRATGDYQAEWRLLPKVEALRDYSNARFSAVLMMAEDAANDHDVAGSRSINSDEAVEDRVVVLFNGNDFEFNKPPLPTVMRLAALSDWARMRNRLTAIGQISEAKAPGPKALLPQWTRPWLAYANARLGNFAAAWAQIDQTPLDCYLCVRMRGNIAAAEKQWANADRWFTEAARQGPSLPFAYTDWGQALMARGDLDAAIAKFTLANEKGPHFADPLEMWGEALTRENRSDLALAKFEEADKYAPNWGRLHLKWGEALYWAGHKDEARRQFAIATHLDLSAADKAALTRVSAMHG